MIDNIIVADEDPTSVETLARWLVAKGYQVAPAHSSEEVTAELATGRADLLFVSSRFCNNGLVTSCDVPVVVLGEADNGSPTEDENQNRPYEILGLPPSCERVFRILERVEERQRLLAVTDYLRSELSAQHGGLAIVGQDPRIAQLRQNVPRLGTVEMPVMICGEPGVGKKHLGRAIHEAGPRRPGPFVRVDCTRHQPWELEKVVFGANGDGAARGGMRKAGRAELGSGGTLLVEGIERLPLTSQAKLLRLVDEGMLCEHDGHCRRSVDVRIICTTTCDLYRQIEGGAFREDLFFRLSSVYLTLPALRTRLRDVPLLVDHFVSTLAPGAPLSVEAKALRALSAHHWPGNVGELESAVRRAVVVHAGSRLALADFDVGPGHSDDGVVGPSLREAERQLILRTLRQTGGNKTKAARILKIAVRTLSNKLESYRAGTGAQWNRRRPGTESPSGLGEHGYSALEVTHH